MNAAQTLTQPWFAAQIEHGDPYRNPHAYQGTQSRHGAFGSRQQRSGALKAEAREAYVTRRAAARGQ
jgi:hypothetical protein